MKIGLSLLKTKYVLYLYFKLEKNQHNIMYILIDFNLRITIFVKGSEISLKGISKFVNSVMDIQKIINVIENMNIGHENIIVDVVLNLL